MTHTTIYPKADHTTQWYGPGNSTMKMANVKFLLHTTETAGGWPGYDGGLEAPTLTYEPWQHKWRQHFPINGSARALQNAGLFQTNRADVVQVEISCYCDPSLYGKYGHAVIHLDDQAIEDLADFVVFLHNEWGMEVKKTLIGWPPYPASLSLKRMGTTFFANFRGLVGHEHAPGNVHGDPGDIAIDKILELARHKIAGGGSTPTYPKLHTHDKRVPGIKERLKTAGFGDGLVMDDYYGHGLRESITKFQLSKDALKGDADGLFGPLTWKMIMALPTKPLIQGNPDIQEAEAAVFNSRKHLIDTKHPKWAHALTHAYLYLKNLGYKK